MPSVVGSIPTGHILTSDFEVTTWNKGNPFDQRNKAVCLAWKENNGHAWCDFVDNAPPEWNDYNDVNLFVFFNAKFDLHWYRKCGVDVSSWKIWCCQLAEFLLSGQTERYPSLENTAIKYGLGHKLDVIKLEYWDKGINTDEIPRDILSEYAKQDVELTYAIYLKQLEQFQANSLLFKLFKLQCQDLLVLEEMEWNGLVFDEQKCLDTADVLDKEIEQIKEGLSKVYPDVPINFNSGDQLSAFLFGGVIKEETKEHIGFFKTGDKAGQPKYKNVIKEHVLPRLVEPGKSTKKDGVFKTDEATLRKLKGKAAKTFVGPLLRLAELDKLNSTYYRGLVNKRIEMNWPKGEIHGQFNQVVAATGRLSSSQPNLQNFSGDCLDIFVSRYE